MAVDIGRALSGLGAAFKNEMPAFIQQVRQEDLDAERLADREMALTERRKKTMFQDMAAAKILFDAGDYRGIADLMEDRVNLLRNTDADTSHSRNYGSLAVRAAAGDPQAISELGGGIQNGVAVGYATGMIPMPVDTSTTLKEGDVVYNRNGSIRFDNRVPEEPKEYDTYTTNGVEYYSEGPNAGLSLGRVAENIRNERRGFRPLATRPENPREAPRAAPEPLDIISQDIPTEEAIDTVANYVADPTLSSQDNVIKQVEFEARQLEKIDRDREISFANAAEQRAEEQATRQGAEEERRAAEEVSRLNEVSSEVAAAESKRLSRQRDALKIFSATERLLDPTIYNDSVWNSFAGPIDAFTGLGGIMPWGATMEQVADLENDFGVINAIATLEDTNKMEGILTDTDIALIQRGSTGMNRTNSVDRQKQAIRIARASALRSLQELHNVTEEEAYQMLADLQEIERGDLDAYKSENSPDGFDTVLNRLNSMSTLTIPTSR